MTNQKAHKGTYLLHIPLEIPRRAERKRIWNRLYRQCIGSWNRLFYCSLTKFFTAPKLYSLIWFSWFKKPVLLIEPLRFICNQIWKDLGPPNMLKFAQTLTFINTIFTQLTENIFELHKISMPIQISSCKNYFQWAVWMIYSWHFRIWPIDFYWKSNQSGRLWHCSISADLNELWYYNSVSIWACFHAHVNQIHKRFHILLPTPSHIIMSVFFTGLPPHISFLHITYFRAIPAYFFSPNAYFLQGTLILIPFFLRTHPTIFFASPHVEYA